MPISNAVLEGHLGNDPELKYSQDGKASARARIAVNTGWGENAETTWWNLLLFGRNAENFHAWLKKGSRVTIVGTVSAPELTDKTGRKFNYPKIVVSEFSTPPKSEQTGSTSSSNDGNMPF